MNKDQTAPRVAWLTTRWRAVLLMLVLLPASLLLHSCGFHLRGNIALPEEMKSLAMQGTPPHGELATAVRNSVVQSGGEIVSDASIATAILVIKQDDYQRRVLSVDSQGHANAYELNYQLTFQLNSPSGEARVMTQQIKLQRQYRFDSSKVLAKSDEERRIVSEMRRNATLQMLRRLVIRLSVTTPSTGNEEKDPNHAPAS